MSSRSTKKERQLRKERHLRDLFENWVKSSRAGKSRHVKPFARGIAFHGVSLGDGGGVPDLFLVGRQGALGLVEVKLGANKEFGAFTVFQLLGYYVHIISRDWGELRDRIDQAFWRTEKRTLAQEIAERFNRLPASALPRIRMRHDKRKYRLYAVVDRSGWEGKKGKELRQAGKWASQFLTQARVMKSGPRAWFAIWRGGTDFKVVPF